MKLSSKKGFSLVELIIVIAILGIIAVIAVPNLTNVQKKSQLNADIRTAEQIGKAMRIWLTDADLTTIKTRENSINGTTNKDASGNPLLCDYSALNASGLDLGQYISMDYKPKAMKDAEYYVYLNNNKIEVYIHTEAKKYSDAPTTQYEFDASNVAKAGWAYKEK